jgi:MFS family permease
MNELSPATQKPTKVRYGVLGFACALSMITYLDRVCFGSAMPHLVDALGLKNVSDLKWAVTAFAFSYAVFEVPSGWLGDVYGPRRTLIRIVLWWSVFTSLTGFVYQSGFLFLSGLALLVVVRFLFGMGEAGAYPNLTRSLHNWFPMTERGSAQGAVWMAGRLMGGLTPLIWMALVDKKVLGEGENAWRGAFWIFGVLGVLWCVAFAWWFRDRPDQKPEVNEAEKKLIFAGRGLEQAHANVPWLKLLTSGNLWMLCGMYFCAAFAWYFNITYLPSFLEEQYGVPKDDWIGAVYKGGPLWMGAITCLVGGYLSDRFIRATGNRKWGRRLFGLIGHGLCGLCFLMCLIAPSVFWFFLAISMAAFWNDLTMGAAWATCQDVGRRYAAIVAGCMNTIGNLGGAAAGWLTGTILEYTLARHAASLGLEVGDLDKAQKAAGNLPGYHINFAIFAAACGVAVMLWFWIDATRPVAPEEETQPHPQPEAAGTGVTSAS